MTWEMGDLINGLYWLDANGKIEVGEIYRITYSSCGEDRTKVKKVRRKYD